MSGRLPAGTGASQAAVVRALQAALAAEHAAIYGYGVAGAHLTGHRLAQAQQYWDAHQSARDTLTSMLAARGATPAATAAAYNLPFPVRTVRAAVALAALLEDRLTTAYLGVVALANPGLRAFGARSARSAALRAAAWRHRTVAFPGLTPAQARTPRRTPAP